MSQYTSPLPVTKYVPVASPKKLLIAVQLSAGNADRLPSVLTDTPAPVWLQYTCAVTVVDRTSQYSCELVWLKKALAAAQLAVARPMVDPSPPRFVAVTPEI